MPLVITRGFEGAPLTYATWNPLDKDPGFTLSNGDLDATSTASFTPHSVRATIGKSSGKWYWEITIQNLTDPAIPGTGVGSSSAALNNFVGFDVNGWGYYNISGPAGSGQKATGNSFVAYGAGFYVGDVIGVALDMDVGQITMYKNGVSQGVMYTGLSGTLFPMASNSGDNKLYFYRANFGQSAFSFAVPGGFNPGLYL